MSSKINMNELYLQWWLETLENNSLARNIQREQEVFTITDGVNLFYNQHYVRKDKVIKSSSVSQSLIYTYDYSAEISTLLINKLIGIVGKDNMLKDYDFIGPGNVYQQTLFYAFEDEIKDGYVKVRFDAKPPAKAVRFSGGLGSSRDFKYIFYLLFQKGIYINKTVPTGTKTSLFNKTFVPDRYIYTDGGTKIRKGVQQYDRINKWLTKNNIIV